MFDPGFSMSCLLILCSAVLCFDPAFSSVVSFDPVFSSVVF